MGTSRKHHHKHRYLQAPKTTAARSSRCRHALCCGSSRLSVSSSGADDLECSLSCAGAAADPVSSLAHAMVQAKLEQMIRGKERQTAAVGRGGRCVVLVALDKSSYDPREDFRESMREVITINGMEEPRELRHLLNCYMSMNPREHRVVILEAFHDVCASLFLL